VTRALAVTLLVVGAVGIVVAVVLLARDDGHERGKRAASATALALSTRPAVAPFAGLTETELSVGGRCRRLVVADDLSEQVQGLRNRSDLGAYDGMLFAYDRATNVAFTMSTVPVPLEIGFYSADGSPVSRRHMKPCPRAEADCPVYRASAPFTFALETLSGELPSGALSSCN
jgi:uncharacterized membrane protein (UPF0127 family)